MLLMWLILDFHSSNLKEVLEIVFIGRTHASHLTNTSFCIFIEYNVSQQHNR